MIATKKANGEAAHLSCCLIDGEYVWCGGSKNVHLMFRKKGDYDGLFFAICTYMYTLQEKWLDFNERKINERKIELNLKKYLWNGGRELGQL